MIYTVADRILWNSVRTANQSLSFRWGTGVLISP